MPANIVAEAISPAGAAVSWTDPTAVDDLDGSVPATCTPASGSTFPLFPLGAITTVTCTASDGVGNTSSATFTVKVVDTTPPGVTASRTPGPNTNGWNNTNVTVSASGTDSGSGIASCTTVVVSAEAAGQTATVSCTDKAGNTASATMGNISIDRTAPTAAFASRTPAPNPHGWNNTDVSVSFNTSDNLSGVDSETALTQAVFTSSPQTIMAEGVDLKVAVGVVDLAGNSASFNIGDPMKPVKIDKTAPVTTATPGPNSNGWNNTDVSVALAATDNLSGVAKTEYNLDNAGWVAYTAAIKITAEGIHTLQHRSTDKADNQEATKRLTVRIDKTPPEAFNQFAPNALDLAVLGRDGLSGVDSVALVSSVPTKWGNGDDDEYDDNGEPAELRTYKVTDKAENTLVVVEKVKKAGHEIKALMVSLQYNSGAVITLPKNKKKFEWALNKDGSFKELEQKLTVGQGKDKQEVEAKFDGKKIQTTIKVDEPKPETKVVKPGLVLLRMATDKGKLTLEF